MSTKIEIPISHKKIGILLIGGLLLICGGLLIAIHPDIFIPNIFRLNNPEVIRIIGIIGASFFGLALIYGMIKLFDKKAGLIIDAYGITDNSNASSIGLIEWKDVDKITTEQVKSTKFILIYVKNPKKYINRAKTKVKKMLMRANMIKYGTPITIISNTLKCNFSELERLIVSEYKKNKDIQSGNYNKQL